MTDGLWLPQGEMRPAGYVVLQRGVRIDRVVGAYDRWLRRVPGEYRRAVLGEKDSTDVPPAAEDPQCLGLLKHYHSLGPMGQEARRPVFLLRSADVPSERTSRRCRPPTETSPSSLGGS
ncbi:hypothetical protein BH23ACT7_BH23ACT7_12350 [soil metagenome]|jgi:hypothetical protein